MEATGGNWSWSAAPVTLVRQLQTAARCRTKSVCRSRPVIRQTSLCDSLLSPDYQPPCGIPARRLAEMHMLRRLARVGQLEDALRRLLATNAVCGIVVQDALDGLHQRARFGCLLGLTPGRADVVGGAFAAAPRPAISGSM